MPIQKLPTLRDRVCNGTFGNLNSLVAAATIESVAAGTDHAVQFIQVDAGTRIDAAEITAHAPTTATNITLTAIPTDGTASIPVGVAITSGTARARHKFVILEPVLLKKDCTLQVTIDTGKTLSAGKAVLFVNTVYRGPQG